MYNWRVAAVHNALKEMGKETGAPWKENPSERDGVIVSIWLDPLSLQWRPKACS